MQITKLKGVFKHCLCFLILSVLFLGTIQFSLTDQAQAAGWWDTAKRGGLDQIGSTAYGETNNPADIRIIISRIIYVFLGLLGIIVLVILFLAGFKYLTAQGDEEKVREAIAQIRFSIIGLLIILSAFSIAYFITLKLQYVTTGIEPVNWYK